MIFFSYYSSNKRFLFVLNFYFLLSFQFKYYNTFTCDELKCVLFILWPCRINYLYNSNVYSTSALRLLALHGLRTLRVRTRAFGWGKYLGFYKFMHLFLLHRDNIPINNHWSTFLQKCYNFSF